MNNWITISCNKKNLKVVRDFVTDFLAPYDLPEVLLNQITLAVDEITANVIIHSNKEDDSKFLKLTITPKEDCFLFEIADKGISFDRSSYVEPDVRDFVRIGKKGGVGFALVNRIMDKVEFTSQGSNNICRLYKRVR